MEDTEAFTEKLNEATSGYFQLTTDGFRPYENAVSYSLGTRVDYAMLIKVYASNPDGEQKYSPPVVIETATKIMIGDPDPSRICTSIVERSNLSIRTSVRRLTRLTNAFSKKWEHLRAMLALYFAYYNFCRIHSSIRCTPAMESGITEHRLGASRSSQFLLSQLQDYLKLLGVDWHFWVSTLITAAIGAAAWVLALQQLRINKNLSSRQIKLSHAKLQFDLYERRLALFFLVKKFLVRVLETSGEVNTLNFYRETIEAEFLFDKEIVDYIREVHNRAKWIKRIKQRIDERPTEPEWKEHWGSALKDEFDWFNSQQLNVVNVFSKELSIKTLEFPGSS
jgi:hypothetical protein